jgi:hypothetical protein
LCTRRDAQGDQRSAHGQRRLLGDGAGDLERVLQFSRPARLLAPASHFSNPNALVQRAVL